MPWLLDHFFLPALHFLNIRHSLSMLTPYSTNRSMAQLKPYNIPGTISLVTEWYQCLGHRIPSRDSSAARELQDRLPTCRT